MNSSGLPGIRRNSSGPLFSIIYFWHPLGTPFLRILEPTWVQLASQLGTKVHLKSCQEGSKCQAKLHYVFHMFVYGLDASWVEFCWVLGLKLTAKLTKKSIIKTHQNNVKLHPRSPKLPKKMEFQHFQVQDMYRT